MAKIIRSAIPIGAIGEFITTPCIDLTGFLILTGHFGLLWNCYGGFRWQLVPRLPFPVLVTSTFLPIVNIGIRPKSVKSKAANPEIKLLKISVLFLQPIRYHVIDSLQSCMSITWDVWPLVPLLVRCVVCLQFTPTVFSYNWVAFLKSSSSFDFEQWKKRSQRKTEIVIDGRSICHSWQCFQLAFLVTWKLTFSAQSKQVSTNVPFFKSAY